MKIWNFPILFLVKTSRLMRFLGLYKVSWDFWNFCKISWDLWNVFKISWDSLRFFCRNFLTAKVSNCCFKYPTPLELMVEKITRGWEQLEKSVALTLWEVLSKAYFCAQSLWNWICGIYVTDEKFFIIWRANRTNLLLIIGDKIFLFLWKPHEK